MQFDNFYSANPDPGTPAVISGNQIDAGQIGIWMNLFYGSAQGITIENNTLNSTFVSSVISQPPRFALIDHGTSFTASQSSAVRRSIEIGRASQPRLAFTARRSRPPD